jgi:hypothetical protein
MPTLAPPDIELDEATELAIREALANVRQCQFGDEYPEGACPQPAEWALHASCGCCRYYCPEHHDCIAEVRLEYRMACHLGVQTCQNCDLCNKPMCLGGDRWYPL